MGGLPPTGRWALLGVCLVVEDLRVCRESVYVFLQSPKSSMSFPFIYFWLHWVSAAAWGCPWLGRAAGPLSVQELQ